MTLDEFRQQHPEYDSVPDAMLVDALHEQYYSDMPREEFNKAIGYSFSPPGSELTGAAKTVDDVGRSLAQGGVLGSGDEFSATMNAATAYGLEQLNALVGDGPDPLPYSEFYDTAIQQERDRDASIHPGLAIPAQIAGALATARVAAPAYIATGATRLPWWLQGVGIGTGTGGVAGFAEGEGGLENRLEGALVGAGTGGLAGVTMPLIINQLTRFGKPAVNAILRQFESDTQMALPHSARIILNRLSRDEVTIDDAIKQLRELGDEAAVADLGGENMLGLARATGQASGPSRNIANDFYTARQSGAHTRVLNAVNEGLSDGDPQFYSKMAELSAERAAKAQPLYNQAYVMPYNASETLETLIARPSVQAALKKAADIAREQGEDVSAMGFRYDNSGNIIGIEQGSWKLMDYVRRGLDDVLEQYRDTTTGKLVLDNRGRAIADTRAALNDELRNLNPFYAAALDAWSGPTHLMNILGRGRGFLRGDPEDLDFRFDELSPSEQEMFRMGAAQELKKIIESAPDNRDLFNRLWGNAAIRQRLNTLFPDQEALSDFAKVIQAEHAFQGNMNTALPRANSQTFGRAADALDLNAAQGTTTGRALMDLLRSTGNVNPADMLMSAGRLVGGMRDPGNRAATELGPLLFNPNNAEDVLKSLNQLRANKAMGAGVNNALVFGGAPQAQGLLSP